MHTANNYAGIFCSSAENDPETLEKIVRDFPASSVVRFMLLYHQKKNNDPSFENSLKQSGIYLNNPCWIQYQLLQANEIAEPPSLTGNTITTETFNTATTEENIPADAEISEYMQPAEEKTKEETTIPVEQKIDEINTENTNENKDVSGTIENTGEATETETPQIHSDYSLADEAKEEQEKIDEDSSLTETKEKNHIEIAEENPISKSLESDQSISDDTAKEKEPDLQIQNEATSTEDDTITFEPLHTVDYFASQGIKISEEALENDQLGKQVKSFTAWLKSMKRLHPGKLPEQNEVIEKIIQSSAEASNKEADILTEAMAEVLVMQDKKEKAIEMYEKLSLLNPSKSAYFAAKIESLKTS